MYRSFLSKCTTILLYRSTLKKMCRFFFLSKCTTNPSYIHMALRVYPRKCSDIVISFFSTASPYWRQNGPQHFNRFNVYFTINYQFAQLRNILTNQNLIADTFNFNFSLPACTNISFFDGSTLRTVAFVPREETCTVSPTLGNIDFLSGPSMTAAC